MTSDGDKLPTGFGRLWTAQTVSSLGDGVSHAALPLLALALTRDPMALAVVTAAGQPPAGGPGRRRSPPGPGPGAARARLERPGRR
ncbi:hypothetical protein AB0D15_02490, partial [Streptomyces sp. NPDC048551]